MIAAILAVLLMAGCTSSPENEVYNQNGAQIFDTNMGKIHIKVPSDLTVQDSGEDAVYLAKPSHPKTVITIMEWDPKTLGISQLSEYAKFTGYDKGVETAHTTDDNNPLLFYVLYEGLDNNNKPTYSYAGYIDYIKEKGVIVAINGNSKTRYESETVTTFTDVEFLDICKSFGFEK